MTVCLCCITVMPFSTANPLNTVVNFTVMGCPVIKPALIYCKCFNKIISTESETSHDVPGLIVNDLLVRREKIIK